jgi:carboxymethylenebutenolidase
MERRLTVHDFDHEVIVLFNAYVHGNIDRRTFLDRAHKFATAGMTAAGMLAALSPDFAAAQQVKPDDARLKGEWVDIPSPQGNGKIRAYLVRSASAGAAKLPAVLVVHENRGLNPHIEDVARRVALDGFMALAPDALTPLGGYPGDEQKAVQAFSRLDRDKTRQDFLAAAQWLMRGPTRTASSARWASAGAAAPRTGSRRNCPNSRRRSPSTGPRPPPKTRRRSRRSCWCSSPPATTS